MLEVRPDGLYAGHPYVWADWALHIALAARFAYQPVASWFDSYPLYAGAKLTYPSTVNLISGVLMRGGLDLVTSFLIPSFIFSLGFLLSYLYFVRIFFTKQLPHAVAVVVFFCSGGLGAFLLLFEHRLIDVLFMTDLVTTQVDAWDIHTNNVLASMLFSQRAFLLGFPLAISVMTAVWNIFTEGRKYGQHTNRLLVICGITGGLLPIIHTHSFLILVLFSFWTFLLSLRKFSLWLWYGVPAVGVSLLVFRFFLSGNVSSGEFISFHPGWLAEGGALSWVWFWVKNWGVFFIGAIVGTALFYQQKKKSAVMLTLFFWTVFAAGNLVQFQPQLWDNTKIFAYAYAGLAPAFVYLLIFLWKRKVTKIIAILIAVAAIFSGGIDLLHNLNFETKSYRMLSAQQIQLGEWVRTHTPHDAVFASSDRISNPIAMIGGRAVLLGYEGWMFNFNLPYAERDKDLEVFYKNPTAFAQFTEKYSVDYILVGDEEEQYQPDKYAFDQHYRLVFENSAGRIYTVK